jgi:hypothetical protein
LDLEFVQELLLGDDTFSVPLVDKIDHLIPLFPGDPFPIQLSPRLFFSSI